MVVPKSSTWSSSCWGQQEESGLSALCEYAPPKVYHLHKQSGHWLLHRLCSQMEPPFALGCACRWSLTAALARTVLLRGLCSHFLRQFSRAFPLPTILPHPPLVSLHCRIAHCRPCAVGRYHHCTQEFALYTQSCRPWRHCPPWQIYARIAIFPWRSVNE